MEPIASEAMEYANDCFDCEDPESMTNAESEIANSFDDWEEVMEYIKDYPDEGNLEPMLDEWIENARACSDRGDPEPMANELSDSANDCFDWGDPEPMDNEPTDSENDCFVWGDLEPMANAATGFANGCSDLDDVTEFINSYSDEQDIESMANEMAEYVNDCSDWGGLEPISHFVQLALDDTESPSPAFKEDALFDSPEKTKRSEDASNTMGPEDRDKSAFSSSEIADLARRLGISDDIDPEKESSNATASMRLEDLARRMGLGDNRDPDVEMVFPTKAEGEWSCIEDYDWQVLDNYKKQLAARPTGPNCPYGVLWKIFDIGPSPLSAAEWPARINFHFPDFFDTLPLNPDKFLSKKLVVEFVRDGVFERTCTEIENRAFSMNIDLRATGRLARVEMISIYIERRNGIPEQPLASFYNTKKNHIRPFPNLRAPVVRLMFELDIDVYPLSVLNVVRRIREIIDFRLESRSWSGRPDMMYSAWYFFQVSLPRFALDHELLYQVLRAVLTHVENNIKSYPVSTSFPYTIEEPHAFINGERLSGPLIIEHLQRGPVIFE